MEADSVSTSSVPASPSSRVEVQTQGERVRVLVECDLSVADAAKFLHMLVVQARGEAHVGLREQLAARFAELFRHAIEITGGNRKRTARLLEVSRATFYRWQGGCV